MKRSHWMTAVFALAALAPAAWAAAPAAPDKSPLGWVPATAPVVIHLNGPETLRDHVVATPSKDVAADFAKTTPGLDGKMDKAQAARFLASDEGVYVDMEAVNKQYGDQIKAAHKAMTEQFDKLAEKVPAAQKGQFEM